MAYKQVAAFFGHRQSRVQQITSLNELVDLHLLERNQGHCTWAKGSALDLVETEHMGRCASPAVPEPPGRCSLGTFLWEQVPGAVSSALTQNRSSICQGSPALGRPVLIYFMRVQTSVLRWTGKERPSSSIKKSFLSSLALIRGSLFLLPFPSASNLCA